MIHELPRLSRKIELALRDDPSDPCLEDAFCTAIGVVEDLLPMTGDRWTCDDLDDHDGRDEGFTPIGGLGEASV